ncbi:MAG: XRE family transcriptional regulator [Propionibacteriales bacterium]|nr:XRE family transcriptional regulator [Propionibacteriales bacterium]
MSNERLRAAMDRAGLSIEAAARETQVDPKTVQRWLAGRVPHPRHRWALAELVDEREEFLWPAARRRQADALGAAAAEVVAAYPYRADVDAGRWWGLVTRAERQIDLLGYTLYFLPQQHPQLIDVLCDKSKRGCKVRMALADPESEHVRWRDDEEQQAITLVARINSSLRAFEPLLECDGAEMRYQDAPLYNSIFRFDDEMFVTPHLYATPGHSAPLLHLRRIGPSGLFSRFAAHFEGIWADTRAIREDQDRTPVRAGV